MQSGAMHYGDRKVKTVRDSHWLSGLVIASYAPAFSSDEGYAAPAGLQQGGTASSLLEAARLLEQPHNAAGPSQVGYFLPSPRFDPELPSGLFVEGWLHVRSTHSACLQRHL